MKTLLILCFAMVVTLATGEPTPVPEEKVRNLVERIRAELPQGWSVSYEAQYAWLEVKRNKPAATITGGINYSESEKRENDVVFFSLRVLAKIEPAEYDRCQQIMRGYVRKHRRFTKCSMGGGLTGNLTASLHGRRRTKSSWQNMKVSKSRCIRSRMATFKTSAWIGC